MRGPGWQFVPTLLVLARTSVAAALVTREVTVFGSFASSSLHSRLTAGALALALCGVGISVGGVSTQAETSAAPERVRGFFCNAKDDSLNFLVAQAGGENEEMAANAVNKKLGKFSCAYYTPADAIYTGEHTVIRDGLVFKLHSFMFLPEKVERWSGTVFGSLRQSPNAKHDV
jgi:hypothetical protein